MTISHLAIVILGWVGAAASIAAYYLVSSKRFAPDSLRYHSLNVSSCILRAACCLGAAAWPARADAGAPAPRPARISSPIN